MRFVFSPPAEAAAGLLTLPWERAAGGVGRRPDHRDPPARHLPARRPLRRRGRRGLRAQGDPRAAAPGGSTTLLRHLRELGHPGGRGARRRRRPARTSTPSWSPASSTTRPPSGPCSPTRAAGTSPTGCSTPRSSCSCGCTWPASCGATARCRTRSSASTPARWPPTSSTPRPPRCTRALRRPARYDLDIAFERVAGELFDLQAGELLAEDVDPVEVAEDLVAATTRCGRADQRGGDAAARAAVPHRRADPPAQRPRLRRRRGGAHRGPGGGSRLRMTTRVAEPGHHRRCCSPGPGWTRRRTRPAGCSPTSPASAAGWSRSRAAGCRRSVAANRWLTEVYEPSCDGDPARPARAAGRGGDLPRDPRAPLVPVRGRRPGRRHDGRGPDYFDTRAAGGARRPGAPRRPCRGTSDAPEPVLGPPTEPEFPIVSLAAGDPKDPHAG